MRYLYQNNDGKIKMLIDSVVYNIGKV